MDQCMLDVSDVESVAVGDEVVLLGRQGEAVISVDEVAESIGTINYEVVCMVSYRVPRKYI
jgi:alanine racemase